MKRWWLFLFFGLALAQGALDAREALRLALAQNPTYQNAREALQTAQLELEALRADPSTLILPLTQAEHALALAEVQAKAAALWASKAASMASSRSWWSSARLAVPGAMTK